jgi:hypothetical protein
MWDEKEVEGLIEALRHYDGVIRPKAGANTLSDIGDERAVDP